MRGLCTLHIFCLASLVMLSCTRGTKPLVVSESVVIEAPLTEVWEYNSIDKHARDWSVFFAKIVTCPESECPENIGKEPGEIGSIRRCFRNEDESGLFWDEKTLKSELSEDSAHRKIITYNIHGYDWEPAEEQIELEVDQYYEELKDGNTRLTFQTKLRDFDHISVNNDDDPDNDLKESDYKLFAFMFRYLSGPRTREIFEQNLANIKAAIEMGEDYQRPYPYQKFCDPKKWYCSDSMSDY